MTLEDTAIKEFKLNNLLSDSVIFCIGPRRSGKSYLLRDIMHEMSLRKMPYGQIYSVEKEYFSEFFPKSCIKSVVTEGEIESLLENQQHAILKDGRGLQNNYLLLLDQPESSDELWKKSKAFEKVFTLGRCHNIMILMSLQFPLGVKPVLRQNVDYVFLFRTESDNSIKKAYDNYGGVVPTFEFFKKLFYESTNDHGCMVIDRTVKSKNWSDKIFHYKAKNPGKFLFGSSVGVI